MLPFPPSDRNRGSAPLSPSFAPPQPALDSYPAAASSSAPLTSSFETPFAVPRSVAHEDYFSDSHRGRDLPDDRARYALAPQQVTTVVTTTTTRTVEYPPLIIPAPPRKHPLDLESYPLAKAPTPPFLRSFSFDLDGLPTSVSELRVDQDQVSGIQSGTFRNRLSASREARSIRTTVSSPTHQKGEVTRTTTASGSFAYVPRKRPISPETNSDMITNSMQNVNASSSRSHPNSRAPKRRGSIGGSSTFQLNSAGQSELQQITSGAAIKAHMGAGPIPIPLTPFPESNPIDILGGAPLTDSGSADVSNVNLPSPTASPTNHAGYLNDTFETGPSLVRSVGVAQPSHVPDLHAPQYSWPASMEIPPEFSGVAALGDIPYIISTFDTLPPQLKSYLLLQLLRRCQFPTLQFVSSLILPSLKRDYVALLPVELAYHILQYLDLRSLGRCAAVSRAWKRVVDGEGAELAVWKKRLQCEGWYDDMEVREEIGPQRRDRSKFRPHDAMDECDDDAEDADPIPINGKQGRNDWPVDWEIYGAHLRENKRPTESFAEGVQTPPNLFKNLYRRHHVIRQNWFHGRYKHISFPGHAFNVVTCLQFDADKIVSGSDDQTIHIYDTRTGGLKKRLEGHEGGVWALQYWNEVLVSGSTDRSVRVWDMEEGACTHLFEGHTSTVRCLIIIIPHKNPATGKMEPEVPLIVTGSRDATLRVWKLPHPKRDIPWLPGCGASSPSTGSTRASNPFFKYVLCGHSDSVRAIAGYGNTLVSGSYDCTVRVWDLGTGAVSFICRGHRQKVYSVGYSHELRRAVSGSMDATVRIWCTRTGAQLFNLEGHTSLVGLLELSPQYLVSAAADATLRIWSPTTGQCLANLTGHSAAITCFHHEPRLNRIVSGSDGGVKVWELNSTGYGSGQPPAGAPFVPALAFTQGPNGPQPVHGRFIRDLVGNVQGVWRVRMDEQRLVCAVQRDGGPTWFEVLDFTEGIEAGVKLEGLGDQEDSNDGSCAGGSDEDDDGDDDDDDVEDEDYAEMGDNGSRDGDDNSFGTLSTDSNPEDVEEIELPPRPPRR